MRRRTLVLVALLPALAGPAVAEAVVRSQTVTDPVGDVGQDGTFNDPTKWSDQSIDMHQATFSSDTSTGRKQLYAKVRLRNLVAADARDFQEFYLDVYKNGSYLGIFYVSSDLGLGQGIPCGDKHLTMNRTEEFFVIRFAASCVNGGGNLRFQLTSRYVRDNRVQSYDLTRKSDTMDY